MILVDVTRFDGFAFDLDEVLTPTATVHAAAWKRLFDELLVERAAGGDWVPFDADYRTYVDGKPRRDGLKSFLAARAISIPEGSSDDGPERNTIHGLAARKNRYLEEHLARTRRRAVSRRGAASAPRPRPGVLAPVRGITHARSSHPRLLPNSRGRLEPAPAKCRLFVLAATPAGRLERAPAKCRLFFLAAAALQRVHAARSDRRVLPDGEPAVARRRHAAVRGCARSHAAVPD